MGILRFASLAGPILLLAACATAPVRAPVTFAPEGTYVQVEPEPDEYTAVAINQGAFSARVGNRTLTGQHWVDEQGRYHRIEDTGPCAGTESVWTHDVRGDRVILNLVSDECATRNFPSRMVYERVRP